MTLDTTARPSFVGYIYQIEYALLLLFKAERDEAEIANELMDDVHFSETGTSVELFQLKHHISRQATLTDKSADLWKSIRTWSEHFKSGRLPPGSILTLVTTAAVSPNTICEMLKPTTGRDNKGISEKLLRIASDSTNQSLQAAFAAYLALSEQQQEGLTSCIRILDDESNIKEISDKIKPLLQVRFQYREQIYARLHEWWFERIKRHVVDQGLGTITKRELYDQIADINEQFRPQALPIDFRNMLPPEPPDATNDQRVFVHQLRQIMLSSREIELAIVDYYRAFEQRSRWQREQLLHLNELEDYERRLVDEWERNSLRIQRQKQHLMSDENGLQTLGREVFDWCQDTDLRIRDEVNEPYVRRGSFSILANEELPRIWWHPEFLARLQQIIPIPDPVALKRPAEILNLFNAAFSARVIRASIKSYQDDAKRGMPFALTFLILPIVLHKPLRESLPRDTRTKMHMWLRNNQPAKIQFSSRTRSLVPVTKESLMFGMQHAVINLDSNANFLSTSQPFRKRPAANLDTEEVREIEQRAQFLGKWFAKAGSVPSIYMMWSIRP